LSMVKPSKKLFRSASVRFVYSGDLRIKSLTKL
jgi:hypothetical protein